MPTHRPLVPIPEQARSVLVSDAAREAALIEELMALLPMDLNHSVAVSLGRNLYADLRAVLADPSATVALAGSIARERGVQFDEEGLQRRMDAMLREHSSGDSRTTVDPTTVRDETEHAKHELVTYWLSMLITAWDLWGHPSAGLPLDPTALLPEANSCPRIKEWSDAMAAYSEALASSIALDMDRDVPGALHALASAVFARAQRGPVTLPRGFAIVRMPLT
jgi:hypothetical protein